MNQNYSTSKNSTIMCGSFHEFNKLVQSTGGTKQVNNDYFLIPIRKKSILTPEEIVEIHEARNECRRGDCLSLNDIKRKYKIG